MLEFIHNIVEIYDRYFDSVVSCNVIMIIPHDIFSFLILIINQIYSVS